MDKKRGNGKRSGRRVVRDLPLSDAATPGVQGGSVSLSDFKRLSSALSILNTAATGVVNEIGAALQTTARNV